MTMQRTKVADPYAPPTPEGEGGPGGAGGPGEGLAESGTFAEDEVPRDVMAAIAKTRVPALLLSAVGLVGGLLFAIGGLMMLTGDKSAGGAAYFVGLATACAIPSAQLARYAQKVQTLEASASPRFLAEALVLQASALKWAAIAVFLVVVVTGFALVAMLAGPRWD